MIFLLNILFNSKIIFNSSDAIKYIFELSLLIDFVKYFINLFLIISNFILSGTLSPNLI